MRLTKPIKSLTIIGGLLLAGFAGLALVGGDAQFPKANSLAETALADQDQTYNPRHLVLATARGDSLLEEEAQGLTRVFKVGRGDTLSTLLVKIGVDPDEAQAAIASAKRLFNPKNLKIGQEIAVMWDRAADGLGIGRFTGFKIKPEPGRQIVASREAEAEKFTASEETMPLARHLVRVRGEIDSSLFESARALGISHGLLSEMIRVLSYDVDFQREVQPGDGFEVMFERFYDEKGRVAREGNMLYVAMELSDSELAFYRHTAADGFLDYYNRKGESVRKALLRTPIDGAKLTSGYGLRRHPVLGYSRMHKGVDFGAPTGTPIHAAGDGTIEMAGYNGAYGNYVRIKHGSDYSTAYAHMSRIAAGIGKGRRVHQGQIIGYVGSTGMSTGAHLHYEVMVRTAQINPLSVKLPSGRKLEGKELDRFKATKLQTETLLAQLVPAEKLAEK